MKSLKQLSLAGLALMLVFTSCTMEKRIYMPGYNVEWKKGQQNSSKQELVNGDNEKKTNNNEIVKVKQLENKTNTIDNATIITNDNITASIDNQQIILPQKEKNNLFFNSKEIISYKEKQLKPVFNYILKKETQSTLKNNGDEPKINEMALAGFICSTVGFFLVIIAGWPFMLGTIGVVFSSIGLIKINKDPSKWKGKSFAIAGLVVGIVTIILFWMLVALAATFLFY